MSSPVSWSWSIPSLRFPEAVRAAGLASLLRNAAEAGFVIETGQGVFLALPDQPESEWLQGRAYRAWWHSQVALPIQVLREAAARFLSLEVRFAAVSAWTEFPLCEGFEGVGTSTHAGLRALLRPLGRRSNIETAAFGEVPDNWVEAVLGHVAEAKWQDRHARDGRFSAERVLTRRLRWTRQQLTSGEGLLFARFRGGKLRAYLMVPIDRSTEELGGGAIAGVNALCGCLEEGRWHVPCLLRAAFSDRRLQGSLGLVQYQRTNQAIALAVERSFRASFADRYDVHWRPDALVGRDAERSGP